MKTTEIKLPQLPMSDKYIDLKRYPKDDLMPVYYVESMQAYARAAALIERESSEARAGWLAQLVIDKLGGTNDLGEWVRRSASYYAETLERADKLERILNDIRMHIQGLAGIAGAPKQ